MSISPFRRQGDVRKQLARMTTFRSVNDGCYYWSLAKRPCSGVGTLNSPLKTPEVLEGPSCTRFSELSDLQNSSYYCLAATHPRVRQPGGQRSGRQQSKAPGARARATCAGRQPPLNKSLPLETCPDRGQNEALFISFGESRRSRSFPGGGRTRRLGCPRCGAPCRIAPARKFVLITLVGASLSFVEVLHEWSLSCQKRFDFRPSLSRCGSARLFYRPAASPPSRRRRRICDP